MVSLLTQSFRIQDALSLSSQILFHHNLQSNSLENMNNESTPMIITKFKSLHNIQQTDTTLYYMDKTSILVHLSKVYTLIGLYPQAELLCQVSLNNNLRNKIHCILINVLVYCLTLKKKFVFVVIFNLYLRYLYLPFS